MRVFFKAFKSTSLSPSCHNLDNSFQYDAGEIVSKDSLSHVLKTTVDGTVFYIKRYFEGGKGLRRFVGRSRCRAEWENIAFCASLGIPTPDVMCVGEEYVFARCCPKRALLITEEVQNTKDLEVIAREYPDYFQSRVWRTEILLRIADYVKRLHDKRFIHNDLNWRNILVTLSDVPTVYFFDMPLGQIRSRLLFPKFRNKDLARLDKLGKIFLRRTERLAFYKAYFKITKLSKQDKKRIHEILHYFQKK